MSIKKVNKIISYDRYYIAYTNEQDKQIVHYGTIQKNLELATGQKELEVFTTEESRNIRLKEILDTMQGKKEELIETDEYIQELYNVE